MAESCTLTQSDIEAGLRDLGLSAGDHVLVHSALSSFGRVEGGADAVIDALLVVVGTEGTVLMPTFGGPGDPFDPGETPSGLGAITEAFRKRPQSVRSGHPKASVAGIGRLAGEFIKEHELAPTAHGNDTPYVRLADAGGKVLLLGVDQDRNTTLHTAEALAEMPYLSRARGRYVSAGGEVREGAWDYFPGPHRNFIGLDRRLRDGGVVEIGKIGPCVARLMNSRRLIDAIVEMLRADPAAVLTGNPAVRDGVTQRAKIFADVLEREAFTLAATSSLLGRYVEEMVERAARYAVRHVELTTVKGRWAADLRENALAALVENLAKSGLAVSALRDRITDPARAKGLFERCAAVGIKRIVLPFYPDRSIGEAARESGVTLLVMNERAPSSVIGEYLDAWKDLGVQLAFHPANFAAVGELPFLYTFTKTRLKRFAGQYYIVDGTSDGRRTGISKGNAEINELISITRCSSYDGYYVLDGRPGRFEKAARKFFQILDREV